MDRRAKLLLLFLEGLQLRVLWGFKLCAPIVQDLKVSEARCRHVLVRRRSEVLA